MTVQALRAQNRVLISRCKIARDFFSRFMGLMGRKQVDADEGILFPQCNSVHTFFMRIPIDVVRLDAHGRVLKVEVNVPPWRMLMPSMATKHILELRANRSQELGIAAGTLLQIEGVWS
jgi:uncharacterized protein